MWRDERAKWQVLSKNWRAKCPITEFFDEIQKPFCCVFCCLNCGLQRYFPTLSLICCIGYNWYGLPCLGTPLVQSLTDSWFKSLRQGFYLVMKYILPMSMHFQGARLAKTDQECSTYAPLPRFMAELSANGKLRLCTSLLYHNEKASAHWEGANNGKEDRASLQITVFWHRWLGAGRLPS